MSLLCGSMVGYPSDSLASCFYSVIENRNHIIYVTFNNCNHATFVYVNGSIQDDAGNKRDIEVNSHTRSHHICTHQSMADGDAYAKKYTH